MKRLRILVLLPDSQLPPQTRAELGPEQDDVWSAFELVSALRELGHEVRTLGVHDELAPIREAIASDHPHVVFNLILDFHGAALYDAHVVSYLELLKTPYTGCNPRGLLLASDKTLSKKILSYHRIRTPHFAVVPRGRALRVPARLRYPLFVKSSVEHASLGISQASIVHGPESLAKRVEFVHASIGTDVIVEEYVEGRELTLGILGNARLTALPVWELFFDDLPDGAAAIATSRVKWSESYQAKHGIRKGPADLPDAKVREIVQLGKRTYRALGMSGYARIDLRMAQDGSVHVIEANPNPDLSPGEDLAASAEQAGITYPELLARILAHGLAYPAGWKTAQ